VLVNILVQKSVEIRFGDSRVYDVRICTVGVDHFIGVSLDTFTRWQHCTVAISNQVCFINVC